jgi:soluble lytic murein transglycosylase-like protein
MSRNLYLIGVVFLGFTLPVRAGESIVLQTGFRLAADRHEVEGDKIRIFLGDGVTEMAASLVAAIEEVETPAAEPPKADAAALTEGASAAQVPAAIAPKQTPVELAWAAARKYSLPDAFVAGVMRAESGFHEAAVSPKGAIGLMQLMPETARELGVDPMKPAENAEAGARYLRDLLARYEDRPDQVVLALAAYNAGPAAVEKYHGVPPFPETREYIWRVLKAWNPALFSK